MNSSATETFGRSVEDCVKAIYQIRAEGQSVSTADLAVHLNISAPAVSKMLRRLVSLRLITHTPYQTARLTQTGERMAVEIIRHHRLLERYLQEALGYSWENVHEEAERLEHHISEEFEERIDAMLGHPVTCPHGDPIPDKDLVMPGATGIQLSKISAPVPLKIERVRDENPELLRYLKEIGMLPGTQIELIEQEPFGGAYIVRKGDITARVPPGAAAQIFVSIREETLVTS